jgi:sulfonate transport system substrate-binding protein
LVLFWFLRHTDSILTPQCLQGEIEMSREKIRIGGVPEHFNLPIHLAIEQGQFTNEGIEVEWISYPGGTGQMTTALETNACDLCMVLTEGIITAISKGIPAKIISGYVKSPLIWGIHTGNQQPNFSHESIFNKKIAISRPGSGSHLMPSVDALMKGCTIPADRFVPVRDLDGAIDSLQKGESEIFYWEKYTTKPFVDKGYLKRIGEFVTPWPCFVIAATNQILTTRPELVRKTLRVIHLACEQFMNTDDAPLLVSKRYNMASEDASFWFHATEWASHSWVSDKMLQSVVHTLKKAKLLPDNTSVKGLIWEQNATS